MAQGPEQTAEQLDKVTARLEQLARRRRGGPLGGLRPFLLGAIVGAGAALLYAPQAGEQTREFVRRNATDLQESATQGVQTAKEKIQERTGAAQDTARDALPQASPEVEAAAADSRAQARATAQKAKQAVTETAEAAQATAATAVDTTVATPEERERKVSRPKAG